MDENEQFGLVAPKSGDKMPVCFNIVVTDIKTMFGKAEAHGFTVIQPLTEMPAMGLSNAVLLDPFGYIWMLHQIDKEISYEERCRFMEQQGFERRK